MEKVEPGMVLGNDLFDMEGRPIIPSGSTLSAKHIQKLKNFGFFGIYIIDDLSKDIIIEPAISQEIRNSALQSIRNEDIDGCKSIAKQMVEEVVQKGIVSLDMKDLKTYDDYTYAHSVNVAVLCCVIGIGMGIDQQNLSSLVTAALLHDLGKLHIPEAILKKEARLTSEEYDVMKNHAVKSYQIIADRKDIPESVKKAVLLHHENVDGSGYPQGLTGEEQSIFVKILHVADVYDALTSQRPYKKPYSASEAAEYLMGACGIMFDYQVVEHFLQQVPLYPKGTEVRLSDGKNGIIYENGGIHNLRPIVRLFDGTLVDLVNRRYLNLTILSAEEIDTMNPTNSEKERRDMILNAKKPKILVVDDMATNLQSIRAILEMRYDLVLLKTGEQALKYLENNERPDLVLMDIDLPGMDGIETARRINDMTGCTLPILFVTALCDVNTVWMCKELKAAGYIVRPYKPVFIKTEIERIIHGWKEV